MIVEERPQANAQHSGGFLLAIDPAHGLGLGLGLGLGPLPRRARSERPDRTPTCDRCGGEMSFLGQIPPGRLSTGKLVFRCYTCNRVISLPPGS